MGAKSPTCAPMLLAKEREVEALELRIAGKSYAQIASAMGIAKSTAYAAVQRAAGDLDEERRETAERYREVELLRLERAHEALWEKVKAGDLQAIEAMGRLSDRRRKLLGIDGPMRVAHEFSDDVESILHELMGGDEDGDGDGESDVDALRALVEDGGADEEEEAGG